MTRIEGGFRIRDYGGSGPVIVLLHGGPGAPGYMAPVARGLEDSFRVVEPFQRGSGVEPLTVARHIEDLHELLSRLGASAFADHAVPLQRPVLVGHSWGAMLALAYAARHPAAVSGLLLIGCGTFDPVSRECLRVTRESRMNSDLRRRLAELSSRYSDPDERFRAAGNLIMGIDSHQVEAPELELEWCDARAHDESWQDMLRLQEEGVYPAAFAAIREPVLLLHGVDDPHPGPLIEANLRPHLPQLEYRELERCGHYPWLERSASTKFFSIVREWLFSHRTDKRSPL